MERVLRDIYRSLPLLLAATLLLWLHGDIAQFFNRPELGAWGMFGALALYGAFLSHVLRRIYFPYLDMRKLAEQATEKGLVFLGVCIVLAALLLTTTTLVRADTLPANARQYAPLLLAEQRDHWPDMPDPAVLMAQVEKETCITLKHRRCWTPYAELKTDREWGVGFGQITKTSRFDALAELRSQFPEQLRGWAWDSATLYDPAFQMRGLVLMDKRNFNVFKTAAATSDRLAFMLASYNGGVGGTLGEIAMCRGAQGCRPDVWFGNVEHTSKKGRTAANGYGQGFFHINRGYVRRVLARAPDYRVLL